VSRPGNLAQCQVPARPGNVMGANYLSVRRPGNPIGHIIQTQAVGRLTFPRQAGTCLCSLQLGETATELPLGRRHVAERRVVARRCNAGSTR
jgi:hypothetical protein